MRLCALDRLEFERLGHPAILIAHDEKVNPVAHLVVAALEVVDVLEDLGGADQALFSIDANSGVLVFSAAPDFEAPADAGTNFC